MAFQEHRNYVDFDDMEADILEIVHESVEPLSFLCCWYVVEKKTYKREKIFLCFYFYLFTFTSTSTYLLVLFKS